jgi:hypothetical protein
VVAHDGRVVATGFGAAGGAGAIDGAVGAGVELAPPAPGGGAVLVRAAPARGPDRLTDGAGGAAGVDTVGVGAGW